MVARTIARSIPMAVTVDSHYLRPCLLHCFLAWFVRADCAVYLFIGYLNYTFQCVIELFLGDLTSSPPTSFEGFLPQEPECSKPQLVI